MSDLRERAASILNGATGGQESWSEWDREVFDVVDEAADEIASLRAQLAGCKEMFAHTAERANEYAKAFQQQEGKLASARKALEPFAKINLWTDHYPDGPRMLTDCRLRNLVKYEDVLAARSALTDENGK